MFVLRCSWPTYRQCYKMLAKIAQLTNKSELLQQQSCTFGSCIKTTNHYSQQRNHKTKLITSANIFAFSTSNQQKTSLYLIHNACQPLIKIDSLLFDDLCIIFGNNYILEQRIESDITTNENEQLTKKQLRIHLQKQNQKQLDVQMIFNNIKIVYEFLSASKIGFLRGDLHSVTFYQLHKDISQTIKQTQSIQRRQQIYYEQADFKRILNFSTNPTNFRLPVKGIYNRKGQSKINLYQRQIILQQVCNQQSHDKFQQILQSLMKLNKVQEAQAVRRFIIEWLVPVTVAIKEEQSRCYAKELTGNRKHYAEYLVKIDAQKLATVALTQLIIQTFEAIYKQGSIDDFQIQQYQGIDEKKYITKVLKKMQAQIVFQRQQKIFKDTQREYDIFLKAELSTLKKKQSFIVNNQNMDIGNEEGKPNDEETTKRSRYWKSQAFKQKQKNSPYKYVNPMLRKQFLNNMLVKMSRFSGFKSVIPQKSQLQLGHVVVYLLKQLLKISNKYGYKVPLLISQHKSIKKNDQFVSISILRLNQYFLTSLIPKLQKNQDMFMHMQRSVPTIIKPLPWIQPQIGGYYSQATAVMRYSNCPVQQKILKYADNHRVFQVLNYLSHTPWKINKQVLKIIQEVWTEGGQQNYIPKRYSQMANTYVISYKTQTDFTKKKELGKKMQALRDQHSLRSDFLLKLNIARSFSKLDYFFFPHNLDFRGRVYPVPPHLNHIGNDLVRGLLLFGVGRKIGKNGLRWLKIHCANLMGKDKAPIEEKLNFIEQNLNKIKQFAKNPLQKREWLTYQDCWQAIASIIDLSHALELQNPEDYVSYLHIHQDGSCNGLQHYAALGRDLQGAYQVNLGPGEKPSDIYTHVSKMVIKMIQDELQEMGQDAPLHQLARKLPDNIKRKTIKQTVMTSVYGVTFIGAREQIYRQLRDQNFLSQDQTYQASLYVAKLTLKAISSLFTGAHQIKKWFRSCANIVSKTGNPVGWISPLGLPIVQPYRKQSSIDIIKTITTKMKVPRQIENIPINVMKQTSAFPPNYVHSLDSSHMMYTSEICKEKNLVFAAVHDSYWTHAATVDEMNIILRDQFIKLHSEPLLQNFKSSLENRFPQIQFPPIPQRGSFDLQKIKESLYFFS